MRKITFHPKRKGRRERALERRKSDIQTYEESLKKLKDPDTIEDEEERFVTAKAIERLSDKLIVARRDVKNAEARLKR